LIDFEEYKFGAGINQRFVPEQNVEPEHAIHVSGMGARMNWTTQRDGVASEIHAPGGYVLSKSNRQILTIDVRIPDVA
jgi:hypothetical protein